MQEKIVHLEIGKLQLDPLNPRLPSLAARGENQMLEYIAKNTSIEELMSSIGQNDYFDGEPLVVCKTSKPKKYIVVEGNRRLVALRLLNKPSLIPKRKKIHEIAKKAKFVPKKVPVIIFDERDEILDYLGFRHITGVKQWEPLSKARYLFQLFDTKTKETLRTEERYRLVAQSIGSRRDFVKKSLDAFALYIIIERNKFFKIEDLDETSISFSLIYTAITFQKIVDFLNLDEHPIVKASKLDRKRLKELTEWIFNRSDGKKTALGESRNLSQLAYVVSTPKALKEFRSGAPLKKAYRLTKGASDDLLDYLYDAEGNLEAANSVVPNVKITENISDVIGRVYRQARHLNKNVSSDDN